MELAEKRKFITRIIQKYVKADRATKSLLLNEITEKLKIHRKSALRLLRVYRQRLKVALKGKTGLAHAGRSKSALKASKKVTKAAKAKKSR